MPKCPECKEKISHLRCYNEVGSDFDGEIYETQDVVMESERYECPECGYLIAKSEKEAKKFLKGGIE